MQLNCDIKKRGKIIANAKNFPYELEDNILTFEWEDMQHCLDLENMEFTRENDDLVRIVHMMIKEITNDIANDFQFNTVISKYRELTNAIYDWKNKKAELTEEDKNVFSFAVISLIKLMAPVTVHMSEEIWHDLGNETSIHDEKWCEWDENLAKASKITLVVQVNGKVKDKIEADEGLGNDELKEVALASQKIKELTSGKEIVKVIVVPKKLVNIVVKG